MCEFEGTAIIDESSLKSGANGGECRFSLGIWDWAPCEF